MINFGDLLAHAKGMTGGRPDIDAVAVYLSDCRVRLHRVPDDLSLLDGAAHGNRSGRRRRHQYLDVHRSSLWRAPGDRRNLSLSAVKNPRACEFCWRGLWQQIRSEDRA